MTDYEYKLMNAANDYGVNIRKGYPRVMDETDRFIHNAFYAGAAWARQELTKSIMNIVNDGDDMPFSAKWLKDHINLKDRRLNDGSVLIDIDEDSIISDERGEAGCIDIHYMSQVFWTINKGLASKEWLCSCSPEFRSDDWIPCIRTIGDFKRLFRVATGFDLPLRR